MEATKRRPLHPNDNDERDGEFEQVETFESVGPPPACDNDDKQQPVKNPLEWLVLPWHLSMVLLYSLLLYHSFNILHGTEHIYDPKGLMPKLGGRFKFLSHINLCIQLLFFSIQLLADLIPVSHRKPFQKFSDVFFTCIAFPLAAIVTIVFWGFWAVDRELIYPEVYDKVVPAYVNHLWHTAILIWVLFEVYLFHHHFPSPGTAAACVFVYGTAYMCWLVYIYIQTNYWCYGFLEHLPPVGMALFFSSCLFFGLGLHFFGKCIAHHRWGVTTHIRGL